MSYTLTFDEILSSILSDYQVQLPTVDRSPGSLVYINSAALASCLWGLYKYQDYIARQIFPDTCDSEHLDHWAALRGLTRISGETDTALLMRLLSLMRRPPAGGNRYDYEIWAKEATTDHAAADPIPAYTETVLAATCYPNARGAGTVNVAITSGRTAAQGGEEEPTTELVAAATAVIEANRPVSAWDFLVIAATKKTTNVTMTVSDVSADSRALIAGDIAAYMKTIGIGKKLHLSQLMALAIQRGSEGPIMVTPSADVDVSVGPAVYERIWPGTVTINA